MTTLERCGRCGGTLYLDVYVDGPAELRCLMCAREPGAQLRTPPSSAELLEASKAENYLRSTLDQRSRQQAEEALSMARWCYRFPLPVSGLSPNGDRRIWQQAKARAEYRDECRVELQLAERPPEPLEVVAVTVTMHVCRRKMPTGHALPGELLRAQDRYRPRDEPNLVYALKPLFDALQDQRVIVGDDAAHMHLEGARIEEVDRWADEAVEVLVEVLG